MDPNFLKTLQGLYTQNYQKATEKSKSFSDMLRERSEFIRNSENGLGDMVQSQIANGSNGVPINPVAAMDDLISYHTGNAQRSTDLRKERDSYDNSAQEALNSLSVLMNSEADRSLKERDLGLRERETALKYGSGRIEEAAKGIIGGNLKMENVDEAIRPQVASMLKEMGFNPGAEEKNKILDTAKKLRDRNTGSITGMLQLLANIPGTEAKGTANLFDQLKSQLSLDNRQLIKGTGAISDFESKQLEKAATSLSRDISDKEFRAILDELIKNLEGKPQVQNGGSTGNSGGNSDPLGLFGK